MKNPNVNVDFKVTVFSVAKLTFVVFLGYKIGRSLANVPGDICDDLITAGAHKMASAIAKKLGLNEDASDEEISEAIDKYAKEKKVQLEKKINEAKEKLTDKETEVESES